MEPISSDVLELEGVLGLYNWVQSCDCSKVPSKRTLYLEVKNRLNLKVVNKNHSLAPDTTGVSRGENSKSSNRYGENLSEKRYPRGKVQNYSGVNSSIFCAGIGKRSRPSTLCSIYPISTFSRIHETLLDASYRSGRLFDYNSSSSEVDEGGDDYKLYMADESPQEDGKSNMRGQESKGKDYLSRSERRLADSSTVLSNTEYEENADNSYNFEIDVNSLNNLIVYLRNVIRSKRNNHCVSGTSEYLRGGRHFCFLTLWKKVEGLTRQRVGDLNEEISVWQQLRDVLLLTGMSLKYPTWSGEQLTVIITSIIPKKIFNTITESGEDKHQDDGSGDHTYEGLSRLYFTFVKNSKTVFDLLTVSKLIEENLAKYIDFVRALSNNKSLAGSAKEKANSRFDSDQLSSEEEDFLEAISGYSTCGEYGFDDEGYASVSEAEYTGFSDSTKMVETSERESKIIDSLGLFVNLRDVKRPLMYDYCSSKVDDSISFYNRANMGNSNTTIITSSTTTANTNTERDNTANQTYRFDTNDHTEGFDFDMTNSLQKIGESVVNLGISRKLLQDLVNEALIRDPSSSSSVLIEKEALIGACRLVDDCISHSNSILEQCHKNKVSRGKSSIKKVMAWTFISMLILAFIVFTGKQNNPTLQLIQRRLGLDGDHLSAGQGGPSGTVTSNGNLMFYDGEGSHNSMYRNVINASDCILSRNANQSGVNSDICKVIGDVTVVEKCFTNIKLAN
ncbi:transmembrane domain-containing protein [Cryptosporidium canis]|uniref:Transmembrane domain-containing protein n=1 Tax=Cryptosporidium canis TaxID=195482 RepID=A0ABQ8P5T8_9CRYT|nr:transmembrane domain-containing protein [Cryptosporidium canis]